MTTDAVFTDPYEFDDIYGYDELHRRCDEIRRQLNQRTRPPLGLADTLLYMSKKQRKYDRTRYHITLGTIFFTLLVVSFFTLAGTAVFGFLIWIGIGIFDDWSQLGWNIVSAAGYIALAILGVIAYAEDKLGLDIFWGRDRGAGWSRHGPSLVRNLPATWLEIIDSLKQQFPELNFHIQYLEIYDDLDDDGRDMFLLANFPDDGEDVYLEHFVKE